MLRPERHQIPGGTGLTWGILTGDEEAIELRGAELRLTPWLLLLLLFVRVRLLLLLLPLLLLLSCRQGVLCGVPLLLLLQQRIGPCRRQMCRCCIAGRYESRAQVGPVQMVSCRSSMGTSVWL